jgi:hypothetical protein
MEGLLLLVRDVGRSVRFYGPQGIGLRLIHASLPHAAVFDLSRGTEAAATGPTLTLLESMQQPSQNVRNLMLRLQVDDLQERVVRLVQQHPGTEMDGGVQYGPQHMAACIRSPDGHLIGLVQRQ